MKHTEKYEAYRLNNGTLEYFYSNDLNEIEIWTTGFETFGVWDLECDTPVA